MPEKYIKEIGEEMWEGMKVCADQARRTELGPSKTAKEEDKREQAWLQQGQLAYKR